MPITVEVRNNNVEKALRVLKKKLIKSGQMKELKERQYYQKPSFKKREKAKKRKMVLKKLHRERESNIFLGRPNRG